MSIFEDQLAALRGGSVPAGQSQAPASTPYTPPVVPPAPAGAAPPAPAPYTPGAPMSITYSAPGPVGAQHAAQTDLMNAQQTDINATRGYYNAQGTLIPYSQAELDARANANNARGAYLAEQTRALAAEQGETAAIVAAKKNVGNLQNVAMGQRERDQYAYRYQLAGLPTPVEITLPEGHTGPLPAGVQARLRTLAEILEDKAKDASAMRKFNIEAARIHAETTGLAVTAAEIASGRVRLSIDEVELAMRQAGLDVNQATLNLNRAQQAPPGFVLDEESNRYVSYAEQRLLNAQRSRDTSLAVNGGEDARTGDLGPLTLDGIMSWAVAGGLGTDWEAKVRAELNARAAKERYTPQFIEYVVATIRARQPEGEDSVASAPPIDLNAVIAAIISAKATPAQPPPSAPRTGGLGPSGFR